MLAILFASAGPVLAYAPTSGTGAVPSPVDWSQFAGTQPDLAEAIKATDTGDASYSYAIGLPPAVLSPALSLSYGSSGGLDRELPFGWSLSGPLKIVRPTSREYIHGELLLTGEMGAILVPDGACGSLQCYHGVDRGSGDLKVTYDSATDRFEVYATSGRHWTLQGMDSGRVAGAYTALWRVTKTTDGHGNYIDYSYTSSISGLPYQALSRIEFGGNASTGEAHIAEIEFTYTGGGNEAATYVAGFADQQFGHLLRTISVRAKGKDFARYTLTSSRAAHGGNRPVLTRIDRISFDTSGSRYTHPAMSFSYQDLATTAARSETPGRHAPSQFAEVATVTDSSGETKYAEQSAILSDLNGDGLADYVESHPSRNEWKVRYRTFDSATGAYDWNAGVSIPMPSIPINRWDYGSGSVDQSVMLTDLDGDGAQDLVSTYEEEFAVSGSRWHIRSSKWGVYYGDGAGGFSTTVMWEQAPIASLTQKSADGLAVSQLRQTLIDMNGDGFLDVVQAFPNSTQLTVYYHTGAIRGTGYDTAASKIDAPWLADLSAHGVGFLAGLSQAFSLESIGSTDRSVERSKQSGGLFDLNGDGLLDYVVSPALAAAIGAPAGHWSVYFGVYGGGGRPYLSAAD